MRVAAVILAAGRSSRMGVNKLLLKVDGKSVLTRLLDAVTSKVDETIVVLGHNPQALSPITENYDVITIINKNYDHGMSSSFKKGLSQVKADSTFLVLGDQIGVDPELMRRMVTRMDQNPEAMIISPVYQNRKGHPVLFRGDIYKEIINLKNNETLKSIVKKYKKQHILVQGGPLCIHDFDTIDEFRKVIKIWRTIHVSPG